MFRRPSSAACSGKLEPQCHAGKIDKNDEMSFEHNGGHILLGLAHTGAEVGPSKNSGVMQPMPSGCSAASTGLSVPVYRGETPREILPPPQPCPQGRGNWAEAGRPWLLLVLPCCPLGFRCPPLRRSSFDLNFAVEANVILHGAPWLALLGPRLVKIDLPHPRSRPRECCPYSQHTGGQTYCRGKLTTNRSRRGL